MQTDTRASASTALPEAPQHAVTPMPVSFDAAPPSEAPIAPQTVYGYSRDGIHVVLPDGRITRAYTSHDAARRAVQRGALFTLEDYAKHFKRLPEWQD